MTSFFHRILFTLCFTLFCASFLFLMGDNSYAQDSSSTADSDSYADDAEEDWDAPTPLPTNYKCNTSTWSCDETQEAVDGTTVFSDPMMCNMNCQPPPPPPPPPTNYKCNTSTWSCDETQEAVDGTTVFYDPMMCNMNCQPPPPPTPLPTATTSTTMTTTTTTTLPVTAAEDGALMMTLVTGVSELALNTALESVPGVYNVVYLELGDVDQSIAQSDVGYGPDVVDAVKGLVGVVQHVSVVDEDNEKGRVFVAADQALECSINLGAGLEDWRWPDDAALNPGPCGVPPQLLPDVWNYTWVDAPQGWKTSTAGETPITVAVLDTGIGNPNSLPIPGAIHPDILPNMWINPGEIAGDGVDNDTNDIADDVYGVNVTDIANQTGNVADDYVTGYGHGGPMAGIIGAVGGNGIGIAGMTWSGARIMAVKTLNGNGAGTWATLVVGMHYAIENGAKIINLSLSSDLVLTGADQRDAEIALQPVFQAAEGAGVLIVIAAGNLDLDTGVFPLYPGFMGLPYVDNEVPPTSEINMTRDAYTNVIVVGAVISPSLLPLGPYVLWTASLPGIGSAWGSGVDIYAPGTAKSLSRSGANPAVHTPFQGTSVAAAHVSGAAALYLSINPVITAEDMINTYLIAGNRLFTDPASLTKPILSLKQVENVTSVNLTTNCNELQAINSDLTAFYVLTADIDCDGVDFQPISPSFPGFTGTLDGQGYTISNLTINQPTSNYVGLFGRIDSPALIKDVVLENADITGKIDVGTLVGYMQSGTISNVKANGTVSGSRAAGGLVGWAHSWTVIENSDVAVTVSVNNQPSFTEYLFGGLAGFAAGTVTNCHASGTVTGPWVKNGGLIGQSSATISNSSASGDVSGGQWTGGLVGVSQAGIIDSYATGSVQGGTQVGGLVGYFRTNYGDTISNSYATGNVTGTSTEVGGLIGRAWSELSTGFFDTAISNSYATGNVQGVSYIGGLIGKCALCQIDNSYATGDTIGNIAGGLVGDFTQGGTISDAFSTGGVWPLNSSITLGGLVGSNESGVITNSRWYNDPSDVVNVCVGSGVDPGSQCLAETSTSYFQNDASSRAPMSSWDFQTIWEETASYPVLR